MLTRHDAAVSIRLARSHLKADSSRAFLGTIWWVLEPLLYLGVIYVVFAVGLRMGGEGFASYVLCGLVVWKWVASSLQGAASSVVGNAGLVLQVNFNKAILPLSLVLANCFRFLIALALLLVLGTLTSTIESSGLGLFAFSLLSGFLVVAGFALVLGVVSAFSPEARLMLESLLLMLFFVSGVFYYVDPDSTMYEFLQWNPIYLIVHSVRSIVIGGPPLEVESVAYLFAVGLAASLLGLLLFSRLNRRLAKVV